MAVSAGDKLGPYEILSLLGEGGMGQVWKARDTRLDRMVAIKFSHEKFSERFEREARAVASLNHPNICQLYDVGPSYLVMEFIEGTEIKGPMPVEKAVEHALQILDALDAAHRKHITHRDLKPANILITKQGIKLLDFGLARQQAPIEDNDATVAAGFSKNGEIVGTLQYMSPEQLQGKGADARSDFFAFGCVLYELLSGRRAFDGTSAAGVIALILEREPSPLELSPSLDRIIRKCLAKDPEERFQSARDLKTALAWATEQQTITASAKKPYQRGWIIAAALVIGVAAGVGVSYWRRVTTPPVALRLQLNPPEGTRFVFGQNLGGVALSPDGRSVAYVAQSHSGTSLWIQPLDGTTARQVAGTEGAHAPFWSSDSKSVAFFTSSKLMRTDKEGTQPLVICDAISGRGGAWSSDGRIVFATAEAALMQVPSTGGTRSVLTSLDRSRHETAHYWPQMLPDGQLLFWVRSTVPDNNGIYVASLANPQDRTQVLRTEASALYVSIPARGLGYLLWLRGSTMVAQEFDIKARRTQGESYVLAGPVGKTFNLGRMNGSVSAELLIYSGLGGPGRLTWLDRAGKVLGTSGEPAEVHSFRLAPDATQVAVSRLTEQGRSDLWLVDSAQFVWSRWTSLPGFNANPVWSPDGRRIVFGSSSPRSLFQKYTYRGVEQRLTQAVNNQFATDWSKDGRFVAFDEPTFNEGFDIWMLPIADANKDKTARPWPYLQTPSSERWSRFSPESPPRWIAYNSDETGRYEVYIDSFPEPRRKVRISTGGGRFPQWGADARELLYVSLDDKLMSVTLRETGETLVPSPARELFALPTAGTLISPYEVAPDGRRFLVQAGIDQSTEPLTVVVNWSGLIGGRVEH